MTDDRLARRRAAAATAAARLTAPAPPAWRAWLDAHAALP